MTPVTYAWLVSGAVLMAVVALALVGLILVRVRQRSQLDARIQGAAWADDEFGETALGSPLLRDWARRGRDWERVLATPGEGERLLAQAGWRAPRARALWYAFQLLCPLAALAAAAVMFVVLSGRVPPAAVLLYSVMGLIVAILLPRWILRAAAAGRRQRLQQEVPLFVHLLVLLFEAGLSTRQALASLVREGAGVLPELGREFELVLRQIEAGGDTPELLRGLGETLEIGDLTGVLAVLRQVDRYGGEVREPLLDALKVIEERRSLDLREHVNRLSGRMTVVMVMFFFPALLIFVAGPAFVSILKALGDASAR